MKRLIIISTLFAGFGLSLTSVQASLQRCTPGKVAPLLRTGTFQENGDFFVPGPNGRTYGMHLNGKVVMKKDLDTFTQNAFATAQVSNVTTYWSPSKNPVLEFCDVKITHANGSVTQARLFPYAYVQKK